MIRLYLIRHGRQNSPLCNVNVPLDKAGQRQAELVGERLEKYNIQALYSSNLIRAMETADIINKHLGLLHNIEEDLREISFGDMEGLSDEQIKERFSDFLKERAKAETDIPYPGGESGEDVYKRAFPVIQKIVDDALEKDIENIVIVSHGGVIRTLVTGVLGADFAKKLLIAKDLENCGITQINYDEKTGQFIVERVNDYSHIENEPELLRSNFKKSL